MIAEFQNGFRWLRDLARVTVAAVSGQAVGAAFHLALACDFRVMADDATFVMAEAFYGLVSDLGGTLPLVRAGGYSKAAEICVTGRPVTASGTFHIGLATVVTSVEGLDAAVEELVGSVFGAMPGDVGFDRRRR